MEIPFDYNKIMSDRKLFNEVVYTPLSEAVKILEERQKDKELIKKVEELLGGDIPEPLRKLDRYGINTRQLATPNQDTNHFLKLSKDFNFVPMFSEYLDDKFVSNNKLKYSLGTLHIENLEKVDFEKINIVDFEKYNGLPIKEVQTKWGESLVDFHRNLLKSSPYYTENCIFYDASPWLKRNGGDALHYYSKDMLVYVCYGILFENFIMHGDEGIFVKKVVLPAIENCIKLTGIKPLIVPIPPMDIEEEMSCYFYEPIIKKDIKL